MHLESSISLRLVHSWPSWGYDMLRFLTNKMIAILVIGVLTALGMFVLGDGQAAVITGGITAIAALADGAINGN